MTKRLVVQTTEKQAYRQNNTPHRSGNHTPQQTSSDQITTVSQGSESRIR
jgi:hypothetical protein